MFSASIISKKVAESLDALVLDVKIGKGAFLKEEKDARELAKRMVGDFLTIEIQYASVKMDVGIMLIISIFIHYLSESTILSKLHLILFSNAVIIIQL